MTLSKNMQIQFNNQPGKYILSVFGIGSTEPQKSLANGFFHVFVCVCISGQLCPCLLRLLFISDSSCCFSSGKKSCFLYLYEVLFKSQRLTVTWQPINEVFGKETWKKGPVEYQSSFCIVHEPLSQKMSSVNGSFHSGASLNLEVLAKYKNINTFI